MSLLASIIQEPSFLNHIIAVFYSKKQGTGKSSFLKFFNSVIGSIYGYIGDFNQICDKHSSAQYQKLVNVIEEIDFLQSKILHLVLYQFHL